MNKKGGNSCKFEFYNILVPTGQIIKSALLVGQTKYSEFMQDSILVLQFRNQIALKSITSKFLQTFDKT